MVRAWIRSISVGAALLPTVTAVSFVVPLEKQRVPVSVNGRVVSSKAAYSGHLLVGHPRPQNFSVVFDTGSAHFILPSSTCRDESCRNHRRYDRALSASAIDINYDGTPAHGSGGRDEVSVSYGTGNVVGEFVSEVACLGTTVGRSENHPHLGLNCARARLIHANEMSTEPFNHFKFDGVLGLGLDSLALDPEFSFFGQLTRDSVVAPIFAVFLAAGDGAGNSEIAFGGHNEARAAGQLQWVPVASPEKGYWQVPIKSLRIGTEESDACRAGNCVAILDTGMSSLGVPQKHVASLHVGLARSVPPETPADVDCRHVPGPPLTFDLGDFSIVLEASDYSRPAAMHIPRNDAAHGAEPHVICRASLIPLDLPPLGSHAFLWGEPVLQKYYTAYDTSKQRIGFARAVQPTAESATAPPLPPPPIQEPLRRWSRGFIV